MPGKSAFRVLTHTYSTRPTVIYIPPQNDFVYTPHLYKNNDGAIFSGRRREVIGFLVT